MAGLNNAWWIISAQISTGVIAMALIMGGVGRRSCEGYFYVEEKWYYFLDVLKLEG